MSKRKTERLLGLVVCLLSTTRYLTAEQVRQAVPGYPEQDELFKRMFERDKEDLRDLGVPLETGVNHPFDDDPGYRIRQQAYQLPELRLEADEAAVLGLAARVWRRAELAGAAAGALLKLRAAGIDAGPENPMGPDGGDEHSPVPQGIEPRLGTPGRPSGRCGRRSGTAARSPSATARPGGATRSGASWSRGAW